MLYRGCVNVGRCQVPHVVERSLSYLLSVIYSVHFLQLPWFWIHSFQFILVVLLLHIGYCWMTQCSIVCLVIEEFWLQWALSRADFILTFVVQKRVACALALAVWYTKSCVSIVSASYHLNEWHTFDWVDSCGVIVVSLLSFSVRLTRKSSVFCRRLVHNTRSRCHMVIWLFVWVMEPVFPRTFPCRAEKPRFLKKFFKV